VAVLDVKLTDDEIRALEEPYGPHLPTGFRPTDQLLRSMIISGFRAHPLGH
jgi:hypothetical protein